MSAATSFSPNQPSPAAPGEAGEATRGEDRTAALARLRHDLVRRFPGAVLPAPPVRHAQREGATRSPLHDAPFAWVEVGMGEGGLSWLAAWTILRLATDPLGRPALWVDTHCTLTPGDLLDVAEGGRLVVVRPADVHEAHVAADIALRSGSFSMVALEMHRNLHPTPLGRLSRLATLRCATTLGRDSGQGDARTPLVVWGEPPAFVGPPSGVPRTSFVEALGALFEGASVEGARHDLAAATPHSTDRLRPLDRAADRRPPPSVPSAVVVGRGGHHVDNSATDPWLPIGEPSPEPSLSTAIRSRRARKKAG